MCSMPKWIHDRADHILSKNPDMPKSMAFGIATKQSKAMKKVGSDLDTIGLAGLAGLSASVLGSGLNAALVRSYRKGLKEDSKKHVGKLREISKFKIRELPFSDYSFDIVKQVVNVPKKPSSSMLAHEIGHGNYGKTRVGRVLQSAPSIILSNVVHGTAGLAGLGAGLVNDPTTDAATATVGAGAVGAQLVNEAAASRDAMKQLKAVGSSPEDLAKSRKLLLKAYGTYLSRALATVGSGASLYALGRVLSPNTRKREEKVKEGMSFKPGGWTAQAGFTPAGMKTPTQRLKKSMKVGKFDSSKGLKPLEVKISSAFLSMLSTEDETKEAFATSRFSGPLNPERLKHRSGAPPFTAPPLKMAGPPSEKRAFATIRSIPTTVGKVGKPGTTPPGPSIAQIAKPVGFGKPMPGTTKY